MKKVLRLILCIFTLLFTLLLSIDITVLTIRKISEDYISEKAINSFIDTIDLNELLMENGKELEQVTAIKQELVKAGIPEELVTDLLISKPVKEIIAASINQTTQYILYDEKIDYELNTQNIYQFVEENLPIVSKELQEKNIPKSEYLTEENQDKILQEIKFRTPVIEEKLEETKSLLENKWNHSEYKKDMNNILNIVRKFYSKEMTILLLSIGIFSIIMIVLTRRSFIRSFKWIGFSFLISSFILFIATIILPVLMNQIGQVPELFKKLLESIESNISTCLFQHSIIYLMIGTVLMITNLLIASIKNSSCQKFDSNL